MTKSEQLNRIIRNQEKIEQLLAELQRMQASVEVSEERGRRVKLRAVKD